MGIVTHGFARIGGGDRDAVDIKRLLLRRIVEGEGEMIPLAEHQRAARNKSAKPAVIANRRQWCTVLDRQAIRIKCGGAQRLGKNELNSIG